ncbi:amino acid ABC transporter permease [Solirhodobacter olei]|uniref:amino acid ABC transporter permease n=1 Tax=Solirhodobacter olei TaxID=2493082 RepID=UPI000FDCD5EB|nr:ABC transporter permease subunit [Solirhodobacter olei]
MSLAGEQPKRAFRLSMLVYDSRYRAYTIQVLFIAALAVLIGWLVNNAAENLARLGITPDFSFLWNRAGYDISMKLIHYTNDSTHGRAALVGLINTLFVSALGCVTATILGVVAGVLRLSKNWVIARLMTVYIEVVRNVPLLLWLLVIYAVFTSVTPSPSEFRGTHPKAEMWFWGSTAITNRYVALPSPEFFRSLGNVDLGIFKVSLDLLALIAVIVAGVLVQRALRRRATRIQEATGRRPATWWAPILCILVPVVALLMLLGFHLDDPRIRGFNFSGGILAPNSIFALWFGLSVYTATYIAEIVRAGILAVSKGQTEAAHALGLRPRRTMSLVVLPQALRVIVPPLISQFLNLTKNSTLAFAVAYPDLGATLGGITLNQSGRALECILLMMVTYLAISLLISAVMNAYNRAVRLKER